MIARYLPSALSLGLLALLAVNLPEKDSLGRPLPLALLFGAGFGLVLQRSRFCFWCNLREWFAERKASGVLAIVVALAVGTLGHLLVSGAWLPNPASGRLPPDAHIGPVSLTLALGAFAFGLGMAISGSCISAHFYRLGEGAFGSLIALAGALVGFGLGFLSWNFFWLNDVISAPVIWLPTHIGYGGTAALTLGLLGAVALYLRLRGRPEPLVAGEPILGKRWPAVTGGLLVGFIATLSWLRVGPMGVTAELGSIARTAADAAGLLPGTLLGLDTLRGCVTIVKETLLSRNGVFVLGIVLAAFASARAAGDWQPVRPALRDLPRLFGGGLLLGWGAMIGLGCTVGVILSGIMVGAASGWIFAIFCTLGAFAGWKLRGGRLSPG